MEQSDKDCGKVLKLKLHELAQGSRSPWLYPGTNAEDEQVAQSPDQTAKSAPVEVPDPMLW